jgi:uncharacterized SAM-dependent methyltransferase
VSEIFSDPLSLGKLGSFYIPGVDWRVLEPDTMRLEMVFESAHPAKLPFKTIVLLREQQIAEQFLAAFQQRYLPEHLFYWLPSSAQAWVELCRSTEYKNASRALEVLTVAVPALSRQLPQIRTLCGLGCGEGSKDRVLLEGFATSGNRLNYVAADFSQPLLELAADQVDGIATSSLGCKLDIFDDSHLSALIHAAQGIGGGVLFSVLGNTLGAFGPNTFPQRLRTYIRNPDRFLFDGEIFSEQTLGGYDNPTNRRFAWGPLTGVGITEDDGKLEFSVGSAGDGLFAVAKHFTATRDLRVSIGGQTIEISAGEKLRMSSSIKYASESALFDFVESAQFKIHSQWNSRDGQFVLACAGPG